LAILGGDILATPSTNQPDQCITISQLRTATAPLLANYLHHIRRQQSPVWLHCTNDNETAQHLLLRCPSLTFTNYISSSWLSTHTVFSGVDWGR